MSDFVFAGILPELVYDFHRHDHPHWEFILYVEGTGFLTVGDQVIPFAPGTIVAQPPGIPHHERAEHGYRCLYVGVNGPRLRGPVPVCQDDAQGTFRTIGDILVRECWQKPPGWQAAGEDLVRHLWRLITRWSGTGDDLVRHAEELLLNQLSDPEFRIAHVASRLDVSEEHLRRRFVAATGRSPRAALTRLRIEAASQHLAHGSSVSAAAAACGFSDPFHFSKVYRQAMGKPPSAHGLNKRDPEHLS